MTGQHCRRGNWGPDRDVRVSFMACVVSRMRAGGGIRERLALKRTVLLYGGTGRGGGQGGGGAREVRG